MKDPSEPSASIIRRGVVAVVVRDDRFLVIRRAAGVLAPGKYCFPGGGIEANECEADALVREFGEELGVSLRPLRCIWRSTTRWHIALAWWLGELDEAAQLLPNPAEVESFYWLTSREMLAAAELLDSNRQFLDALAAREIQLG